MKGKIKSHITFTTYVLIILVSFSFKKPDLTEKINNLENNNVVKPYFGNNNITDGPYIFLNNNEITINWIKHNRLKQRTIHGNNFNIIERKFGFEFLPEWIHELEIENPDYVQRYKGVEKLVAISDTHGQYEVMVRLLQMHGVIDSEFNWIFGDGHLVVLGDIFDRGPKVTESLWLIFCLEKKAEKRGGKVHYILGNHEVMILNNDVRYINKKYVNSAQLMNTTYSELFSENSVLGKWLHTKPVIVTINDMLFVHAGVSTEYVMRGVTRTKTNEIFTKGIIDKSWDNILKDSTLSFMMGEKGPIWYRGYFSSPLIKEYQVDHLLRYFNVDHIIVGHTSMPNIVSLFNGKIFGIDSSIKYGDYGEVFIYKNDEYYRGTTTGSLIGF